MIPYGRQDISQADIDAVVDVLNSDYLTQGPTIPSFEQALVAKTGAAHAVAMSNATAALHIACLALDLGPGDRLWTTPITFVASANCGRYCGATIDFVDIDPGTFNMCPDALEQKLQVADQNGTLPKIIIPVHMCGQSPQMECIAKLARQYGIHIIEDASHAIGASFQGKPVGACEYSDIAVFSFHPVKIVTTGEGGAALTNNAELAGRMELLRSHGVTRDEEIMTHASDGPWYYQQIELGYNYRMTEIQAALGISQLSRLEKFVERRHQIAQQYDDLLADLPLTLPWQHPDSYSAYHLYVIRMHLDEISPITHCDVFESFRAKEILVNLHYIPVHTQPYYQKMGFSYGDFPKAEQYYREAISIPMHPSLTDDEQDEVVTVLKQAIGI